MLFVAVVKVLFMVFDAKINTTRIVLESTTV